MDVAEFQEWSGRIARLSRAQRRQTFQTLALSEASDSYDDDLGDCRESVTAVSGETPGGTPAAAEPSMPAPLSRAQTDGLAGSGSVGWTAWGAPIAAAGRSRFGERRVACHDTAAKAAGGPSTL
jgi:hypothetical protein